MLSCPKLDDWRKDGYRFLQNGNTTFDWNGVKGKKNYFKLQIKEEPQDEVTFRSYAYLLENEKYANIAIVQYVDDEKEAVGFPHGNAKKESKTSVDFVGTRPSLLKAMKNEDGTPIQVYRKTIASCSRDLFTHAVNAPRD